MSRFLRRSLPSLLLLLLFVVWPSIARAVEVSAYQAGAYQPGLMNLRDLATPEPGLVLLDYNYLNLSSSYYDRDANKVSEIEVDLSTIDPTLGVETLDVSAQVSGYTNVPVVFYTFNIEAIKTKYMVSVAPVFMTSGYRMNVHFSEEDSTVSSSGNAGGFGDLALMPLGLGWSIEDKFDLGIFYTSYLPTGKYTTGASDNIGKGYWTHQFQAPVYSYFKDKSIALFFMPTFEVNGKVKDADVRAGNRLTIEYGYSQYVTPWMELEVTNGHNWQVGDDRGADVWWKGSALAVRDRTSSVGVGVGFWPWEMLNLRLKGAFDYGVKQRYRSNIISASLIFIPGF